MMMMATKLAMVAMMAKERGVPVLVCAETYKFSEGVVLDAFGKNELGERLLFSTLLSYEKELFTYFYFISYY